MMKLTQGNLLEAPVEALVNTVNTVGIMGRGIALQFKQAYPAMFREYERACKAGEVQLGKMQVFDRGGLAGGPHWIINFPTKGHWRADSRMADIEAGLKALVAMIRKLRIRSIAILRWLRRMANRHGWTPSDTSARLVEEGLRRSEFVFIDFRDSAAGRQACIQGSSLAVWEVVLIARSYENDPARAAEHLQWPEVKVQAAMNYTRAFPEEIEQALEENEAADFESLSRMLPQAKEFVAAKGAKK